MAEVLMAILQLSGTMPTEVGNLRNMTVLRIVNSDINGSIPSEIGRLTQLEALKFANLMLDGPLPEELYTGLNKLSQLELISCGLTGTISTNIGLLTDLTTLYLEDNNLHGTFPTEISSSMLKDFHINGNSFTGTVPLSICRPAGSAQAEQGSVEIVADCAPDPDTGNPVIECSCCTECCSSQTGICYKQ